MKTKKIGCGHNLRPRSDRFPSKEGSSIVPVEGRAGVWSRLPAGFLPRTSGYDHVVVTLIIRCSVRPISQVALLACPRGCLLGATRTPTVRGYPLSAESESLSARGCPLGSESEGVLSRILSHRVAPWLSDSINIVPEGYFYHVSMSICITETH